MYFSTCRGILVNLSSFLCRRSSLQCTSKVIAQSNERKTRDRLASHKNVDNCLKYIEENPEILGLTSYFFIFLLVVSRVTSSSSFWYFTHNSNHFYSALAFTSFLLFYFIPYLFNQNIFTRLFEQFLYKCKKIK